MFDFILKLLDAIVYPVLIAVVIWLCFFLNFGYELGWNYYGMHPGDLKGLLGIITMPFLHGSFEHLFSNTLPLILSMGFIVLYFPGVKWKIIGLIWLVTGVLLWIIGEVGTTHIGASGLVYGYITFIITHAFINRNKQSIAAAFILIFLYGGLIYGVFPEYGLLIGKNISWEGHLSGAIAGVIFGFIYRRNGPQRIKFFEDEDDDEHEDPFYDKEWFDYEEYRVRYLYRPKESEDEE